MKKLSTRRKRSCKQTVTPDERLYLSPEAIARKLGFHVATVRRMFHNTAGVLRFVSANRLEGKRAYVKLRIPPAVFEKYLEDITARLSAPLTADQHTPRNLVAGSEQ
jgi:hypothetical protein